MVWSWPPVPAARFHTERSAAGEGAAVASRSEAESRQRREEGKGVRTPAQPFQASVRSFSSFSTPLLRGDSKPNGNSKQRNEREKLESTSGQEPRDGHLPMRGSVDTPTPAGIPFRPSSWSGWAPSDPRRPRWGWQRPSSPAGPRPPGDTCGSLPAPVRVSLSVPSHPRHAPTGVLPSHGVSQLA